MRVVNEGLLRGWQKLGPRFLPFADAATKELPLGRLLRLSLFQVSIGMAMVLLTGTLNRVMIVELNVPAALVGFMISLPIIFAPFRALIGFKSDTHRSVLGWRRVPYMWFGTLLQFAGFAILPFALLVLTGDGHGSAAYGQAGAALAFLLVGAGLHTTQTAGLALANDLAPPEARPRVVALLYVMLLLGMVVSALIFGILLRDFNHVRLIQVVQGAAVVTFILNGIALWQQESRNPAQTDPSAPPRYFDEAWRAFSTVGKSKRLLVAVGLGTAGFSMQDILLEPYGGQIFGLDVGQTTLLTAIIAGGTLGGFALAARILSRGGDPHRIAALGLVTGVLAFAGVIFAAPLDSLAILRIGTTAIGFSSGLFSVGMLTAAMDLAAGRNGSMSGLAIGAWGAVQATTAGAAVAISGFIRDGVTSLAESGALGPALTGPEAGYSFVYQIEIGLLFAALIAVGPLVRSSAARPNIEVREFGLAQYPG
jgi:BCD family chlorophyll transporter-like MFS transporter